MRLDVPTLETERLRLRAHTIVDFADYAAMRADPIVARYLGDGAPLSEEESWLKFLRFPGYWLFIGYGFWAIEEKQTQSFIGNIGFAQHRRAEEPFLKGVPEIGWALVAKAQGKRYATEAASAVIRWGDACFGSEHTVCSIKPGNLASIGVAEKCGYREVMRIIRKGQPVIVFCRTPQC